MTLERFRAVVKRLHPDANGGSARYKAALLNVLGVRRRQKSRFSKCVCGVTILARSKRCSIHARRRAPMAVLALFLFSLSAFQCFSVSRLMSPREASLQVNATMIREQGAWSRLVSLAPTPFPYLDWWWSRDGTARTPLPFEGIRFRIEQSSDLKSWTLLGSYAAPPVPVVFNGRSGFWRIASEYDIPSAVGETPAAPAGTAVPPITKATTIPP